MLTFCRIFTGDTQRVAFLWMEDHGPLFLPCGEGIKIFFFVEA